VKVASTSLLAPRQLGFGVPGGAEAAVRAARRYLDNMPRLQGATAVLFMINSSNNNNNNNNINNNNNSNAHLHNSYKLHKIAQFKHHNNNNYYYNNININTVLIAIYQTRL